MPDPTSIPAMPKPSPKPSLLQRLVPEIPVLLGFGTGVLAMADWSPPGLPTSPLGLLWSAWLVACILVCAFRAMAHADHLAEKHGEPLGTLILTIAAITIEVAAVCAVMLGNQGDPTVARDSMFSVLMLIFNLLMGLAMLLAGRGGREVQFNPQSSGAYLPLVIALGMITLVLPRFTRSRPGGWMSEPMEVFVGLASISLYGVFLWLQTTRHREFFAHHGESERSEEARKALEGDGDDASRTRLVELPHGHVDVATISTPRTSALLLLALVSVVLIAEGLVGRVRALLDAAYLPPGIGGVLIGCLVLAPEGLAALKAAGRGSMQRCINILLGSALATIGLTVPAVIGIHFITGVSPSLGLDAPDIVLLVATFVVSAVNLTRGRVNALQGIVHILLFIAWLVVILDEASVNPGPRI
jgi:Ca2+:H+ antiporter